MGRLICALSEYSDQCVHLPVLCVAKNPKLPDEDSEDFDHLPECTS